MIYKQLTLIFGLLLMLFTLCICSLQANAQARQQYTGSNVILIGLESAKGIIDYRSDNLQVRYNEETQKIECRLPVNTLYALNDTVPANMAYNVLFGSKYPDVILLIDAPAEIINAPRVNAEPQLRRTTIVLQGTINETKIPVVFASDKGVINLSTNFDLSLGNFNATLPANYIPFLTGRLQVTIRNARWLSNLR